MLISYLCYGIFYYFLYQLKERHLTNKQMIHKFDFLVIGGGIAGMSYALSVANRGRVGLH